MAMKSSPSCEDRENYSWQTAPYVHLLRTVSPGRSPSPPERRWHGRREMSVRRRDGEWMTGLFTCSPVILHLATYPSYPFPAPLATPCLATRREGLWRDMNETTAGNLLTYLTLPILALRGAGHSLRSSVPSFVGPVHSVHSRCAGRGW